MNKLCFGLLPLLVSLQAAPVPDSARRIFETAPLRFEPSGSRYITRGLRFAGSLEGNRLDLRTHDQWMRITFVHATSGAHLEPGDRMRSVSNIIHGNDRTEWRTSPNYATLRAHDLYPGIDLVYYGSHGELEYDFVVKPGVSPEAIRLAIGGASPTIDAEGNLSAAFIQKHPVAYQVSAGGVRTPIDSRYRRNVDGTFGFALGRYDRSRELIIDPVLTFSNYIAGSSQDTIRAIGHDANGFIYVAGITLSTDFEVDPNTGQVPGGPQFPALNAGYDVFIAQMDPTTPPGNNPVGFATYLGGSGDDILNDMFLGPKGIVYLTGYTKSTDFPQGTVAGYQTTMLGNSDAFVAVYDVTQQPGSQLVYSSYLGGGTGIAGNGVTADSKGRVYITGTTNSSEMPVVNGQPSGLNGENDAFVAGFDPSQAGSGSLFYCTFLGGSSFDQGYGITASPDGTLWVVGQTYSADFPIVGNSYQGAYNAGGDAFVAQIDPIKGALLYSTFLGGSGIDSAQRVRIDPKGRIVLTGLTFSGDLPVTSDAVQSRNKGMGDAFIAILNPLAVGNAPQLVYLTYYGGTGADSPLGLALDAKGAIYVSGNTGSFDLPVSGTALFNSRAGGQDGFVLKLDPTVAGPSGLVYASYVSSVGSQSAYGVDVDAKGTIWVAGATSAGLFAPLNGSAKTTAAGDYDGYVMGFTLP